MVKEVTQEELEKIIKEKDIVIVDFSATWCGPCKSLGKVLETKVAPQLANFPDVALVKIDIDKNQDLAQGLNVLSVPSMMFFFKGQRLVMDDGKGGQQDRLTGFNPEIDKIIMQIVDQLQNNPQGENVE